LRKNSRVFLLCAIPSIGVLFARGAACFDVFSCFPEAFSFAVDVNSDTFSTPFDRPAAILPAANKWYSPRDSANSADRLDFLNFLMGEFSWYAVANRQWLSLPERLTFSRKKGFASLC
jgi:hypothetical protein